MRSETFPLGFRLMDRNDAELAEEQSIVRQCIGGRQEAYAVLVRRYQEMVYNVAYRMVGDTEAAKDIAQESFISAYSGLRGFRSDARFSTWLYRIVMNKCQDHLRKERPHVPVEEMAESVASTRNNPEQELRRSQTIARLQSALDLLPAGYREVIILKHMEGLSYEEMEKVLGVKAGALKVKTHRAREMLKKVMKEEGILDG